VGQDEVGAEGYAVTVACHSEVWVRGNAVPEVGGRQEVAYTNYNRHQ
jgi:hypothetical protein